MRTAVASLVITVAGGAAVWRGTDGFRALTSEQARRIAIAASLRPIPDVVLEDQNGQRFTLADYRGGPVVVDFVYTRCRSLCPLLSDAFQRIDRAERVTWAGDPERRLELVSISFDPRDSPARLLEYGAHYNADGRAWRFARVHDERELTLLLRAFGIVVIRDQRGDFQHNGALHVVNARGQLARVLDLGTPPEDVARVAAEVNER